MSDNLLKQIFLDAQNKTLVQFQLKYTGWYLYGSPAAEEEAAIKYKTDVMDPRALQQLILQSKNTRDFDHTNDEEAYFLYEIRKKPSNAWAEWVTIGRAINNDIVLRFPTVSKLHARLEVEATAFGDPTGFRLVDNESTVGTIYNGVELDSNQPTAIHVGDTIIFGNVKCLVLDSTTIWHKLR